MEIRQPLAKSLTTIGKIIPESVKTALKTNKVLVRVSRPLYYTVLRNDLAGKFGDTEFIDFDLRKKRGNVSDSRYKDAYELIWEHSIDDALGIEELELVSKYLPSGGSAFDCGCGVGKLAVFLCEKGFTTTGLDVSEKALSIARAAAQAKNLNIHWVQGFMEQLPFEDNSFDVVTCSHTLEHTKDLSKAVSELKRVCRKVLIVIVPFEPYDQFIGTYHTHFFSKEKIVSAFGPRAGGFECFQVDLKERKEDGYSLDTIFYIENLA